MLIVFKNKTYRIRKDKPNENWTNDEGYVIDDNSDLAQRIILAYPDYEFITKDGALVDISPTEPTPEPLPEPTPIELLQAETAELWHENMILDGRLTDETSAIWYELMTGGM